VTSFIATNSATGGVYLDLRYTRDALGRITKKVETTDGATKTFEYGYDLANRLAEVKTDGVVTASWTYDANGNRTSETKGGTTVTASYDGQDRLTQYGSESYAHGHSGELQERTRAGEGTTTSYRWSALGDLAEATLPDRTTVAYVVDAEGRRVGKKVNGTLVQAFVWESQLRIAAELDAHGSLVSRFVHGSRASLPELIIKEQAVLRIIVDQQENPRIVVNAADGTVIEQMAFNEWGTAEADSNRGLQPFGFAGGLFDVDTGLVRFGAREYDSATGRFLTPEPLIEQSESAASAAIAGMGLAPYAYALGNPLAYYDPDGLQTITLPVPWEIPWKTLSDLGVLAQPGALMALPLVLFFWPATAHAPGLPPEALVPPACGRKIEAEEGEHTKNARPSTEEKHQKGKARKQRDKKGGEKGDARRPYSRHDK
jgi:RHS repeat-associated protein